MRKIEVCEDQIKNMINDYCSGQTIKQVANHFGLSKGVTYNLLRNNGCKFRPPGFAVGVKMPIDAVKKSAMKRKGLKKTEATRIKISEARRCHYNGLNGNGHSKRHNSGYILVYAPEHPKSGNDGYVFEHNVVMERSLGRYLLPDEVVHHINRIKDDNTLDNLCLMNKHDHMSMHMKERHEQRRKQHGTRP